MVPMGDDIVGTVKPVTRFIGIIYNFTIFKYNGALKFLKCFHFDNYNMNFA